MVDAFAVFISKFGLHTVHSIGPNRNDFILNVVVLQILPHVIDHVLKKKNTFFVLFVRIRFYNAPAFCNKYSKEYFSVFHCIVINA